MSYREECSTVAKRKALTRRVCEIITKHRGGSFTIDSSDPIETSVLLTLDGFAARMYFRGRARSDCFTAHWFTGISNRGQTYPRDFDQTIRGSINTHHYGKATSYANTFEEFHRDLDAGFTRLAGLRSAS